MFHMTTIADDRIQDLHRTAAELRHERTEVGDRATGSAVQGMRLGIGRALLAAGTALVGTTQPATRSPARR